MDRINERENIYVYTGTFDLQRHDRRLLDWRNAAEDEGSSRYAEILDVIYETMVSPRDGRGRWIGGKYCSNSEHFGRSG